MTARTDTRDPLLHKIVAGVCRAAIWTLGHLPTWLAYFIADVAAVPLALWTALQDRKGKRSKGYHRNLRIAFRPGGIAPQPPKRLLWRWARHMTWMVVDFCRMPRITLDNIEQFADIRELDEVLRLYRQGKGLIFATGHIGVPEVAAHLTCLHGVQAVSVYSPSPMPAVDRVIQSVRAASGQDLAPKRSVMGTLKASLGRGESIGILADVSSKGSHLFAPFLGTLAPTNGTPALLHLHSGSPIAVVSCERTGRARYRYRYWHTIRHERTGDRKADMQAICEQMNAALTEAIAARPEQWFWQGRRFRHRPPGEVPDSDGLPPVAGER